MGFFSWLREKVEDAKDYVKEKIEDAVESARDWLSDLLDPHTEGISSENSYDRETADLNSTERLNRRLVEFREEFMKSADKIESECVEAVEAYYKQLLPCIEKSQSIGSSGVSVRRIERNKRKIEETIRGSIRQPLSKRMSLDDAECLDILKMKSGGEEKKAKKRAMAGFTRKVIREAVNNLANKVKETLDDQLKDIEEGLREISEKQEKEYSNFKKYFDSFSASSSDEIGDREKDCIMPLYVFDAAGEVLDIISR